MTSNRALNTEYVEGWLAADSSRVLGTLTADAVILPHNQPAFEGHDMIRSFWWLPDGPPINLTQYDVSIDEIVVSGDIGYTRGQHSLGWDYDGQSVVSKGKFIRISRKGSDGVWKYSRLIWNDTP
jgi:ketosteroid isomerase-like protein